MGDKSARSKSLVALHLLVVVYSLSSVMTKVAAGFPFLSWQFVACYGGMLALLGVYALGWQQVIKRLPLTTAYANRAMTIVWGIVWGALLFHEHISPLKIVGALIVLAGVVVYASTSDEHDEPNDGERA